MKDYSAELIASTLTYGIEKKGRFWSVHKYNHLDPEADACKYAQTIGGTHGRYVFNKVEDYPIGKIFLSMDKHYIVIAHYEQRVHSSKEENYMTIAILKELWRTIN